MADEAVRGFPGSGVIGVGRQERGLPVAEREDEDQRGESGERREEDELDSAHAGLRGFGWVIIGTASEARVSGGAKESVWTIDNPDRPDCS